MTDPEKRRSWRQAPDRDESGRLAPEVLAAARRRVRRALLALIVVAIAAGLLAYGCSRTTTRKADQGHYAAVRADTPQSFARGGLSPLL